MREACPELSDEPWREPVRGGHFDGRVAAEPGIVQLRAMAAGRAPSPPLSHLTGMRACRFDPGTATFEMPMTGWLRGGDGEIPLGPLAIPADAAMACAIITLLPAGATITTTELSLRQVRAAEPGETVLIQAKALEAGPPVALADVRLTGGDGRLIGHGASLCVWLPALTPGAGPAAGTDGAGGPGTDGTGRPGTDGTGRPGAGDTRPSHPGDTRPSHAGAPDPWERPAPDPLAPPPLDLLTGMRPLPATNGAAAYAVPASRWLCAPPPGRVQGGAVAMLADAAITAAIRAAAPAEARFRPVEIKLNFLRPLASDGRDARADARLIHGGRRTAVAGADVVDADGRTIAVATGSAVAG